MIVPQSAFISQPIPNVLLFEFNTMKDLSLSFFRFQEFYESQHSNIQGKHFSIEEFLETYMDAEGVINYFSFWEGFNIPGVVFDNFSNKKGKELTEREKFVIDKIYNNKVGSYDKYYVIAALKYDKETIDHELAHALYNMNKEYKSKVDEILATIPIKIARKINKRLTSLGYCKKVLEDETHAYLATSQKKYLREEFGVNPDSIHNQIKHLKGLLKVYKK
jgi:hypothetical protein